MSHRESQSKAYLGQKQPVRDELDLFLKLRTTIKDEWELKSPLDSSEFAECELGIWPARVNSPNVRREMWPNRSLEHGASRPARLRTSLAPETSFRPLD